LDFQSPEANKTFQATSNLQVERKRIWLRVTRLTAIGIHCGNNGWIKG